MVCVCVSVCVCVGWRVSARKKKLTYAGVCQLGVRICRNESNNESIIVYMQCVFVCVCTVLHVCI